MNTAEYHNPQVLSGGGTNTFNWKFTYDKLNRLTNANYDSTSTDTLMFDVAGLVYDKAGNIRFLNRWDESGTNVDDLEYLYYSGTNRLKELKDPSGEWYSWDAPLWPALATTETVI